LSEAEVLKRLDQFGMNKLAEEEGISRLKIFFHQFTSPLIYILLIAGVVTIFLKEYIDSGVIFSVVVLNAIIGFIQEFKAEESVGALKKMVVPKAKVLRDGKEKEINSEKLVTGDIVLLASGVRVPADMRLFKTTELKIDESMLTGESMPVEKITSLIKEDNLTPGDQKNMAFMGMVVVNGRAKGVVEEMDDEKLFEKVKHVSVFARVSPQHKLRIVQQLKKHGHIIAVTGDGVNDAPALKEAHIGVAMGMSGTDVAKEASDMVLTDDNFASIFNTLKEGRIVFDNIRKVTFFLIPTGIAAILSILGTIILGLPIPYVPAQLLWINLVTNGLQDVALAFEPGEKGIIDRPPRNPKEGIMSRILIERTILVGLLISIGVVFNFVSALHEGVSLEKARSIAVTTMVFFQFFQAWNSRSELQSVFRMSLFSNPFLFYSMIAAFFAQLAVLYVPALQWVFRTETITIKEWVQILIVSVTVIIAVEIDKWIRRQKSKDG